MSWMSGRYAREGRGSGAPPWGGQRTAPAAGPEAPVTAETLHGYRGPGGPESALALPRGNGGDPGTAGVPAAAGDGGGKLPSPPAAAPAPEEMPAVRRGLIVVALMLAMFMAAIESTIVSTALPSIVADLGGFSWFSWVFSAFLLTSAATVPIYGKLADLYGRKPAFLVGSGLFLLGSALCGTADSIGELVAWRALQGVGAGAVQPLTLTIVGDLFRLEERARVQGYISSVWGVSAVVGPAAGGFLVQYAGWPWVFYINLPIGLLAMAGIALLLKEPSRQGRVSIDYAGTFWMVVAVSALLVQLGQGGRSWPWPSAETGALLLTAALAGWLFVRQERRAADPLLPLDLVNQPILRAGNCGGLVGGMVLMGVASTVPTFVQGVLGRSPVVAGFSLATMSIGWPLASFLSGRLMLRFGFRRTAGLGACFGVAGALVLWAAASGTSALLVAAGSFLVGVSMGLTMTTYIVSIQESVAHHQRGAATGSQAFARMLGSAVGAALIGAVVNARLQGALVAAGQADLLGMGGDVGDWLLNADRRGVLNPEALEVLRRGLAAAFRSAMALVLLLTLLVAPIARMLPPGLVGPGGRAGVR